MTTAPEIRLATPGDAEAIAEMSRDLIEQGLGWGWKATRVLAAIRNTEKNVAVVGDAGRPVAFGIMRYAAEHAHLELLAVLPSHQRRGLGRALVTWLEDAARVAGAERILVNARWDNATARHFYAELGYHEQRIQRGYYAGRADAVHLAKWLRPTGD